jgi:hypothetical protein
MKKILIYCFAFLPVTIAAQVINLNQPPKIAACQSHSDKLTENAKLEAAKARFWEEYRQNPDRYPGFKRNSDSLNSLSTNHHVLFNWPMAVSSEYDFNYSYFNFENYVDQNASIDPDGDDDNREDQYIDDYNCQNRTYDQHRGQDINLYPFWWRMMDNNYVRAVAAASGVIFDKDDGNFDRNCSCIEPPNRVYVMHYDSTISSYWHLKSGSLTSKPLFSTVESGDYLGLIGSSGCSSWPHLHFEVRDKNNNKIEPFFLNNNCNTMNNDSWWVNQRPYWDPGIARIMTHSSIPALEKCPEDEDVNAKNQFNSGDLVYIGTALIDGQNGDVIEMEVSSPNGTVTNSWNINVNSTASRKYPLVFFQLPAGNTGTWTVRATYRSRVYSHYFTVGCKDNEVLSGNMSGNRGFITGNYITTTVAHSGASNTRILYQAANQIEFKPGFQASGATGLHMKARIKNCTYTE